MEVILKRVLTTTSTNIVTDSRGFFEAGVGHLCAMTFIDIPVKTTEYTFGGYRQVTNARTRVTSILVAENTLNLLQLSRRENCVISWERRIICRANGVHSSCVELFVCRVEKQLVLDDRTAEVKTVIFAFEFTLVECGAVNITAGHTIVIEQVEATSVPVIFS